MRVIEHPEYEPRSQRRRKRRAVLIGAVGVLISVLAIVGLIRISLDVATIADRRSSTVERRLDALEARGRAEDAAKEEQRRLREIEAEAQRQAVAEIAAENRRALCVSLRQLIPLTMRDSTARVLVQLSKDLGCPVAMPDFRRSSRPAAPPRRVDGSTPPAPAYVPSRRPPVRVPATAHPARPAPAPVVRRPYVPPLPGLRVPPRRPIVPPGLSTIERKRP